MKAAVLKPIWDLFCIKFKRRVHRILVHYLPDSKYKQKWDAFYQYWWKFEKYGYSLRIFRDEIRISNDNLIISGNSPNTIWTTFGIFCEKEYDFTDTADYLMIDIGLNIGVASIYFAQKENIKKIYGYEPFLKTYQQALKNIEQNPSCKDKICANPFGLGNSTKEKIIHYNADLPGSMSTVKDLYADFGISETIQIKSASDVLAPIFAKYHNLKKFLKIDCEGAEEEILANLQHSGILKDVDLILLEWHFGCYAAITKILTDTNFIVTCHHTIPDIQGNIIAFSKRKL